MSLTVAEADAVNTVLLHALNLPSVSGEMVPSGEARVAAEFLATRAYKTLGAGMSGRAVHDAWPEDPWEPSVPECDSWDFAIVESVEVSRGVVVVRWVVTPPATHIATSLLSETQADNRAEIEKRYRIAETCPADPGSTHAYRRDDIGETT